MILENKFTHGLNRISSTAVCLPTFFIGYYKSFQKSQNNFIYKKIIHKKKKLCIVSARKI